MAGIPRHLTDILSTPPQPAYRVVLIAKNGTVLGTVPVSVEGDEEGLERARSMVDGHAVELWDGLRFIEFFPPHY